MAAYQFGVQPELSAKLQTAEREASRLEKENERLYRKVQRVKDKHARLNQELQEERDEANRLKQLRKYHYSSHLRVLNEACTLRLDNSQLVADKKSLQAQVEDLQRQLRDAQACGHTPDPPQPQSQDALACGQPQKQQPQQPKTARQPDRQPTHCCRKCDGFFSSRRDLLTHVYSNVCGHRPLPLAIPLVEINIARGPESPWTSPSWRSASPPQTGRAASPSSSRPSSPPASRTCHSCGSVSPSRNELFRHLRYHGHTRRSASPRSSSSRSSSSARSTSQASNEDVRQYLEAGQATGSAFRGPRAGNPASTSSSDPYSPDGFCGPRAASPDRRAVSPAGSLDDNHGLDDGPRGYDGFRGPVRPALATAFSPT